MAIKKAWPETQATSHIEVIVMTTSQRSRRTGSGSPVRRTLGRSLRVLRDLHDEQAYAWERFFLSCRAPQPCTHSSAARRAHD